MSHRSLEPIGSAESLDRRRRTHHVPVRRDSGYDICLVDDLSAAGCELLAERIAGRRALLISTPTVAELYAEAIHGFLRQRNSRTSMLVIECDESDKSMEQVLRVCRFAGEIDLDRRAVLVAVGGGVCKDIVTMAAAWIRRGIDYICVPTTFIGQIDAGIGIKGAVNFADKKSFIGTFHPPSAVLIDPAFLRSLPARHIRYGFAELIKVAVARDRRLFEQAESHWREFMPDRPDADGERIRRIVWQAVRSLLADLETNLYEDQTFERLADLGHTFSPALESASGFQLHHGDAVAIDIALSAELAVSMGLLADSVRERILGLFRRIGLPTSSPLLTESFCTRALGEAALHRGGAPNLVLPTDIGRATFARSMDQLPPSLLRAALSKMRRGSGGDFRRRRLGEQGVQRET